MTKKNHIKIHFYTNKYDRKSNTNMRGCMIEGLNRLPNGSKLPEHFSVGVSIENTYATTWDQWKEHVITSMTDRNDPALPFYKKYVFPNMPKNEDVA